MPFGASPDTLNKQQLREFGEESEAIWKAKTLREIVPLLKRFWNKWEFIFSRYRFGEGGPDHPIKSRLIKLAESEPKLSIRISDYPNTFEGNMELIRDLERELTPKADTAKCWGIKRVTGWMFKKTSHFILTVISAIFVAVITAIVVDIFADFGWLQSIKKIIYSILWPK